MYMDAQIARPLIVTNILISFIYAFLSVEIPKTLKSFYVRLKFLSYRAVHP